MRISEEIIGLTLASILIGLYPVSGRELGPDDKEYHESYSEIISIREPASIAVVSKTPAPKDELLVINFRYNFTIVDYNAETSKSARDSYPTWLNTSSGVVSRLLYPLIDDTKAQSLKFSVVSGAWKQEWGKSMILAPVGATMTLKYEDNDGYLKEYLDRDEIDPSLQKEWKFVTHHATGLLGANYMAMDLDTVAALYEPKTHLASAAYVSHTANIPGETLCTENLTPFVNLLPCGQRQGIAQMMHPYAFMEGSFNALDIIIDKSMADLLIKFTYQTVVKKPTYIKALKDGRAKTIEGCGIALTGGVAIGDTDLISLAPKQVATTEEIVAAIETSTGHRSGATVEQMPLRASSMSVGHGHDRGSIRVEVHNLDLTEAGHAHCFITEQLPWYIIPYWHTLRVAIEDGTRRDGKLNAAHQVSTGTKQLQSGRLRKRPSILVQEVVIPPGATVSMTYDFNKAHLLYEEHYPDSNRSRDVPGPQIKCQWQNGASEVLHLPPRLVSLPVPDFSMPYNVITLTCTIMAVAFGTFFNVSTKRYRSQQVSKSSTATADDDGTKDQGEESATTKEKDD